MWGEGNKYTESEANQNVILFWNCESCRLKINHSSCAMTSQRKFRKDMVALWHLKGRGLVITFGVLKGLIFIVYLKQDLLLNIVNVGYDCFLI